MDEQLFTVVTEDGTEQTCNVIFTFDSEERSYVLYSLVNENGEESTDVSALRYELDENGQMTNFSSLETDEEWEMVEEVLNTLIEEFTDDLTNYFTITNENNEEVICEIVHRFELDEFGKSYIFYTYADEEASSEIFAAAYMAGENGEVLDLIPIENDEEWSKVEEQLDLLAD
ncbi:hypothetical protein CD30_10270 [Ureibacillus massiliensis 4400831 = CIP 108448 = CCUG 49529]|uniref:UPF0473 protein CD30_10270 n=1 Tax=Ureibacillus massiliensis 4400831 = CIP 108448 = CCUG 49529 TaxID=1211035 RepID=A0A0A3J1C1_9BACL|nr:DUF1292 domain-containing protein [Ureibacillus massiliensis]KGR90736.1 hypothetical protein CD30_10270 [Ureibacillus massiliensis 4400831 = CIP 108448 = CCUG 49529]